MQKTRNQWAMWCLAGAAGVCISAPAMAQSVGGDVLHTDTTTVSNYGPIGGVVAYSLGSNTCNVGNQNINWTNNGTPGFAMNMYRLKDGRMTQIGLSFVKTACCAAAGNGCNLSCNGQGGSVLGAGCLDVYSSGWNAGQTRLAPRSVINAYTGAFSGFSGTSGDAVFRRLQVQTPNLDPAQNVGALYFVEGVYVGTQDSLTGNMLNNASHKRVTVGASPHALTLQGSMRVGIPAIQAWRDHGGGVGIPDTTVNISNIDIPNEGRFIVAHAARPLGAGKWRYEYAVFNLNSDRSGGSFSVPMPPGASASNIGFSSPLYHSGEVYSNAAWLQSTANGRMAWTSPQSFAQNANSNAVRWGTMYSYWFDANAVPTVASVGAPAQAELGLFKPHTPQAVSMAITIPGRACRADWDGNNTIQPADISTYVNDWLDSVSNGTTVADIDMGGAVDPTDVALYVNQWIGAVGGNGC